jgi:hypothetical protein
VLQGRLELRDRLGRLVLRALKDLLGLRVQLGLPVHRVLLVRRDLLEPPERPVRLGLRERLDLRVRQAQQERLDLLDQLVLPGQLELRERLERLGLRGRRDLQGLKVLRGLRDPLGLELFLPI